MGKQSKMSQIEVKDTLFLEAKKGAAILLVDTSGSTSSRFDGNLTIFDKFTEVAGALGHSGYRIIFWSSPGFNGGNFSNGVMKLDFNVAAGTLHAAFATASKFIGGGTCPSLGFKAIPAEWLKNDPVIYFLTDGQIGCGEMSDYKNKEALVDEIKKLSCSLCIVAVENVRRDFNRVEVVQSAAGGDIYKLVQDNHLTGLITQFVSHNPDGKFVQINKSRAPPAHAPYGDRYFSELRVGEFIQYIAGELKARVDETSQLEIAQNLSATLEYLTRDKPKRLADDIIRTFSNMFVLDAGLVRFILTSAISKERSGQSAVFANYRAQLKDLFKQADGLIKTDVCEAIGMDNEFVSYVIEDRVLTGSYRLVDGALTIHGARYPRGAFGNVPVFPMLREGMVLTELQEQCLRQWTRSVYGSIYRVHPTADEVIYLVLGNVLKVVRGNGSDAVKTAYKLLGKVMLRKKRLNSMQTELNRLEQGEFPTPNSGKVEDFYGYMRNVSEKLGITASPLKLWHEMCCALDVTIGNKQERHCTAEVDSECKFARVEEDNVPESFTYDYNCIVTLEDISSAGGYRILQHVSPAGSRCSPVYLLSVDGHRTMMRNRACLCPVCYAQLNDDSFDIVGKKINFELPASYNMYANRFAEQPVVDRQVRQDNRQENKREDAGGIRNAKGNIGTLVILKGVVGAGKSTFSQKIREGVLARGGHCLVQGTDMYCKTGVPTRDAVSMVQRALETVRVVNNDDLVVVIDTCGEQTQERQMKVFNVDFTGWKKVTLWPNLTGNLSGYFAWSLRNVLMRRRPTQNDSHYLNPEGAGVQVCIDVHKKKAKALFPKKNDFAMWQFSGATIDNLEGLAAEYEKELPEFKLMV